MTTVLNEQEADRMRAGFRKARTNLATAKALRARRHDADLIRAVGLTEAMACSRDEATVTRRASVALTTWRGDGSPRSWHEPDAVAVALGAWWLQHTRSTR